MQITDDISFKCGKRMKNRFMLAPLTNQQSNDDGSLSEDEFHWLTMRAKGGFGLVMTCASHVQEIGKGFPGQLGIFSEQLEKGHRRLAQAIKNEGALSMVQLHHAGMRSPKDVIGKTPVCPSDNEETGARALSHEEVLMLKNDFVSAAKRAKQWGYDGVEIHGAHGYILTQFISAEINQRDDEYGGNLENRARLLFEIIDETRNACGSEFLIAVRLSPERFGVDLGEIKTIAKQIIHEDKVDFLDISLWDVFKYPEDEAHQNKTLLEHFTTIDRKNTKLTVAGHIRSGEDVNRVINAGVDFVTIGRSAILHHDFPEKVMSNPSFTTVETPVSRDYLINEGLSNTFIAYMKRWPKFVNE